METSPLVIIYWKIVHGLLTFELWWNTIFTDAYWWWTEWSKRRPVLNGWFRQIRDHSKNMRCFSWNLVYLPHFQTNQYHSLTGGILIWPAHSCYQPWCFLHFLGTRSSMMFEGCGKPEDCCFLQSVKYMYKELRVANRKAISFCYIFVSLSLYLYLYLCLYPIYLYLSLSISIYLYLFLIYPYLSLSISVCPSI